MATIYIFKYSNYFNREVKYATALSDYGTPLHVQVNVNFNPNDGVNTGLTVGRAGNAYSGEGDYMVVDEDGEISRWFIIDHVRRLKGQWRLTLRRDVLVDHYDEVMASTAYIQRGTVTDISPFIYNQEPITVNQIKKSERLLKDSTGVAWLCGFISRNYDGSDGQLSLESSDFIPDYTVDSLDKYSYYSYSGDNYFKTNAYLTFRYRTIEPSKNHLWTNFKNETYIKETPEMTLYYDSYLLVDKTKPLDEQEWTIEAMSLFRQYTDSYFTDKAIGRMAYTWLLNENGKIILANDTKKYYRVLVTVTDAEKSYPINYDVDGEYLYSKFQELCPDGTVAEDTFQLLQAFSLVNVAFVEVVAKTTTVTMPKAANRLHLKDAPYDMFCVPFGNVTVKNSAVSKFSPITLYQSQSLQYSQDLVRQLGSNVYDLQLLPYCPMTGFIIEDDGTIDINTVNEKRYTLVYDANDAPAGLLLWSTASQGTFDILLDAPLEVKNVKMSNQCDKYRLVSPNYNGQFEFNLARNGGTVSYFNVDFTYLPYSSYIHVNPQFAGLYGNDFNDVRGLICQGDFSVNYLSDQWAQYQIQNKNYNNIFDRQISNMEVNHKYDMQQGAISALANAAATGVSAGAMTGNAIVGAAAGLVSAAGGVADLAYSEARYKEQRAYTEDVHNMQLENIQAMPYSVAKTTAYSANNKIFPVLEYYTCTESEKQAVAQSIRQSGMNVGVVGTIRDYALNTWSYSGIQTRGFIQAQLIELPIDEDYHTSAAIAEELLRGVYYL